MLFEFVSLDKTVQSQKPFSHKIKQFTYSICKEVLKM